MIAPVQIEEMRIPFVESAEHVGVIRSISGNLPHIHQRLVNHKKSLAAILFTGMSRRHRANPLAAIRAEKIFGAPVLFSGMATLILNKSEIVILSLHVKQTIEGLLKLHQKTPDPVVFLISGTMPAEATLHLKQLTLFGMICRLPANIFHKIALEAFLVCTDNDKSWFSQIRSHCFKYGLLHPLKLLDNPPPKEQFKNLIKLNIAEYWQSKLRADAKELELSSLRYFKSDFAPPSHAYHSRQLLSCQQNDCPAPYVEW